MTNHRTLLERHATIMIVVNLGHHAFDRPATRMVVLLLLLIVIEKVVVRNAPDLDQFVLQLSLNL